MKNLTMKQQIELEMARAEKIREVRLNFEREMAELAKKEAAGK